MEGIAKHFFITLHCCKLVVIIRESLKIQYSKVKWSILVIFSKTQNKIN